MHTCVGVYPNLQYVVNHVMDVDIESNIEFNKTFRPGRVYIVDGEIVSYGLGRSKEFLDQCLEIAKTVKPSNVATTPYS